MSIITEETCFLKKGASTRQWQIGRRLCNYNLMTQVPTPASVTLCCRKVRSVKRLHTTKQRWHWVPKIHILATILDGFWQLLLTLQLVTVPRPSTLRSKRWRFQVVENPSFCGRSALLMRKPADSLKPLPRRGKPQR